MVLIVNDNVSLGIRCIIHKRLFERVQAAVPPCWLLELYRLLHRLRRPGEHDLVSWLKVTISNRIIQELCCSFAWTALLLSILSLLCLQVLLHEIFGRKHRVMMGIVDVHFWVWTLLVLVRGAVGLNSVTKAGLRYVETLSGTGPQCDPWLKF